jgi:hypothetical protein
MTLDSKDTSKFLYCRSRAKDSNGNYINGIQGDYWRWLQNADPNSYASQATIYETLEGEANAGTLTGTYPDDTPFQLQEYPSHPRPR